ncbi:uncharacterized protein OCT59_002124 [Rhizophagus irregularis]|nr:hypothetical protein OCT59_002124 [Rhizophagus irregularis]
MEKKQKNLWKRVIFDEYQLHVTISTINSTTESDDADERVVYLEDLEKRKQVYGICGECNEPGTGEYWCQPCNAKRFKDNFKNWTSGNKNIDEFIQQSQLNATHYYKYFEWIPYERFQNITYVAKGGFSKIYSAEWPEGHIEYWDIGNQQWYRKVKVHLQIYTYNIVQCYGITLDPNTKDYIMVLHYCSEGNWRNYINSSKNYIDCKLRIDMFMQIARGLLDIHNAGLIHKDFHSGNILISYRGSFISDLGMCQPAIKQSVKEEGIYGVLPYTAPEVLHGYQYTKAADIYSFGIIMNEFLSEEIPFNDISHNESLAIKIYKGLRPTISKDVPKLLADLISKCWDTKIENRPTANELYQILEKCNNEIWNVEFSKYIHDDKNSQNSEIYSQIKEFDKIGEIKFNNRSNEDKSKITQTHPQAIYTSRLLNPYTEGLAIDFTELDDEK